MKKAKMKKAAYYYVYRSAKTGKFIGMKHALKHPNTTVREKRKK